MQDICPSTSRNSHIYIRTLHDACVILGGEHKLAAYLGVPVELVEAWLNGRGYPSDAVFLRCVDLVQANPPRGMPEPGRE
jgi:DNA-binding transcriptional regulator YiaG